MKCLSAKLVQWARLVGVSLLLMLGVCACTKEQTSHSRPIRIAVASNFQVVARDIARVFEEKYGISAEVTTGSSGKLYAQIVAGAPYDVFLSADVERPRRLELESRAIFGSRFTYALGQLALHCTTRLRKDCARFAQEKPLAELDREAERWAAWLSSKTRIAVAQPNTAPYGRAALQVLTRLGIGRTSRVKMVLGESVGQAFQFVYTGNASVGLVATSQVSARKLPLLAVPSFFYSPIEQQAILLTENRAARSFLRFLRESPAAQQQISGAGYQVPVAEVASSL